MSNSTSSTAPRATMMQFVPVMLCFFAMGFVDLVGTASNCLKGDLGLSDTQANLFPSLVFFWFLIFSVPTGLLMNKIGRKNTVLVSLVITAVSLVIPIFGEGYYLMLVALSLLGIGNAIMQTSLNPLVSNLIDDSRLASTMTFGQFVKAIASFLAPIIAGWGAASASMTFGLGWRVLFPIYAIVSTLAVALLAATPIREEKQDKASGVGQCLKLLGNPAILLCFLGIMCHVGIDVGVNTAAPKIFFDRLGGDKLEDWLFVTSVYFVARTVGCLSGSVILRLISARLFFTISVVMMVLSMIGLFIGQEAWILYAAVALVGYGNSNIFSIVFSQAMFAAPDKRNEASGLMIMGLFGGTIFPLAMGFASDAMKSQMGSVVVISVGVAYLIYMISRIKG